MGTRLAEIREPLPRQRDSAESSRYDAFISYSHNDLQVAAGIQRGLHRIGRRMGQLHALRVFRDKTDLSARPDLWGEVSETQWTLDSMLA